MTSQDASQGMEEPAAEKPPASSPAAAPPIRRAEAQFRKQGARRSADSGARASAAHRQGRLGELPENGELLRFETLLTDLSARFINVPADQVDAIIGDSQRRVCECLRLDVSALWQWDATNPDTFVLTHYHLPPGTPLVPKRMDAARYFPWSFGEVLAGRITFVPCVDEVPAGGERDQETWRYFGLKNVLTLPLTAGRSAPFGALSFHDLVAPRTWSERLIKRLELVAQVFANALARQRSETVLRESEVRLSLAADSARVGLWSLDLANNLFWLTPRTREFFGFAPDERVSWQRFLAAVHPEDREFLARQLQELVQTGEEVRIEFRVPQADGGVCWMASSGRRRHDIPGMPRCVMGVTVDITRQKLAELALREKEVRLSAAVDVAALGFYELRGPDRQGFFDTRVRAMLGIPDDRRSGTREFWVEHLHPGDRERILNYSRQLLDGQLGGVAADYRYLHPQRGLVWLRQDSRVMERNALGQAVCIFGVIQDITERKLAEEQLLQQRAELAHVARVSTMGQLASSLAHELNQPLGAILRNAEAAELMLQEPCPDLDELRAIVADIRNDDHRAGMVIDRMRDLMKHRQVETLPLDVGQVASDVLALVRPDAELRRVRVVLCTDPGLPLVRGDRVQLQQVVLNLLLNAVDAVNANPPEERLVTVRSGFTDAVVELSVSDNGPGIPADKLSRVFEPFYTSKPNGLGMGLAIARSIVETHGGRLRVENNVAGGATFTFALPVIGNAQR